jgi:hypothetical protein
MIPVIWTGGTRDVMKNPRQLIHVLPLDDKDKLMDIIGVQSETSDDTNGG